MGNKKKSSKDAPTEPRSILQQLAEKPDMLNPTAFRRQVGALCFRYRDDSAQLEVLLVTSRDTGRWIIPKGWPMKGKEPHQAAAIEASEEAGVRGQVRRQATGRYTYLKTLDDGDVVPCVVDIFEIEVSEMGSKFKERGERTIGWFSPDEAARRVREVELKSLLVDFKPLANRST